MRTLFQTQQQQAVALEAGPPQSPPPVCRPVPFVRPAPPAPKRARRIQACVYQAPAAASAHIEQLPLIVPRPGHSRIHQSMYVSNVASLRQVLAQVEISSSILRPRPPTDPYPDPGTGTGPGTVPDGPPLNDIGFTVYSAVVMTATHLADMNNVTAESFLEKLQKITSPLIMKVIKLLRHYAMPRSLETFLKAVDPQPFLDLIDKERQTPGVASDIVYDLINASGDALIETMNWIRIEAPEGRAFDWPPYAAGPAQPAPSEPVPDTEPELELLVARQASKPGIGTKRAKKTAAPRRKR